MNAALLLFALLAADDGSTAAHPAPVQTVELATLTPLTVRPGTGRFIFAPRLASWHERRLRSHRG